MALTQIRILRPRWLWLAAVAILGGCQGNLDRSPVLKLLCDRGPRAKCLSGRINESLGPRVATDEAGNVVVVWVHPEQGSTQIRAARYLATAAWSPGVRIENSSGYAMGPDVASDQSGNAMVVWAQYNGKHFQIWSNSYVVERGWATPTPIETNRGDAFAPAIGMDARADATAVWQQHDGTRWNLWANRYEAGRGWTGATLLESFDGDAVDARIATNGAGKAVVTWRQYYGENYRLGSVTFDDGSTTGHEADL